MNMSRTSRAALFAEEGYNIDIIGHNVLVTDAMKDHATEKISKIERFTNRLIDVAITMEVQKNDHKCDIVLRVDHIKVKSHAATSDMYASLDKAFERIQTQLLRYKSKIQDHQAKPLEVVDMLVNVYRQAKEAELSEVNDDIEAENVRANIDMYRPHEIVEQGKKSLKVLRDDEAIMEMELSGDAFLVFRGEVDRKLKVIYRRDDGDYGILYPES